MGGINLYGIVSNNPVCTFDVLGLIYKMEESCSGNKCCPENLRILQGILKEIGERVEHDLSDEFFEKALQNLPHPDKEHYDTYRDSWDGHIDAIIGKINGASRCVRVLVQLARDGKCGKPPIDFTPLGDAVRKLVDLTDDYEKIKFRVPLPPAVPLPPPIFVPLPSPAPGDESPWWKPVAIVGAGTVAALAIASPFEGPFGDAAALCLCARAASL